ncbi:endoribonuclease YbeY [Clostridium tepidiprofundi DSM 19306]|uniref:Endoribonuclease YbeY n=1 Tax=Clostridium tepidiprofundi DSM 19306 TaxID=1121338 RepID=A0A151B446_9CLOT|nr:rRNA maturation RNase YbeY [Clostridium tepidiprofundi]KYH34532.1 endoribonuclease YbeY [Clostridium tepidiprofundi DSM 19306]
MIYIDNRQEKINVTDELEKKIEYVIDFTLKREEFKKDYEISVIFVDNARIREINKCQRNIDKATDVLSFPMIEYEDGKVFKELYLHYDFDSACYDGDNLILGDIAISLEKAQEQSIEYNHSFEREVCYLIVHSVLHLLGYDHMNEADKTKMREREKEILDELKIYR